MNCYLLNQQAASFIPPVCGFSSGCGAVESVHTFHIIIYARVVTHNVELPLAIHARERRNQ